MRTSIRLPALPEQLLFQIGGKSERACMTSPDQFLALPTFGWIGRSIFRLRAIRNGAKEVYQRDYFFPIVNRLWFKKGKQALVLI